MISLEVFSSTGAELEAEIRKLEEKQKYNHNNNRTWSGDLHRFLNRHVWQGSRKRAKKSKIRFDLTLQQVISMWYHQNGICPGTGVKMEYQVSSPLRVSQDQIIAGNGYTLDNVWLTTQGFNFMKNKYTLVEVRDLVVNSRTQLFDKVYTDFINHRKLSHNSDLIMV